jgi:hypothetical protein
MRPQIFLILVLVLAWPCASVAELVLPPGFTASVYATGDGFDAAWRRAYGRLQRRAGRLTRPLYWRGRGAVTFAGEVEDIWLSAFPWSARLTPGRASFFYHRCPTPVGAFPRRTCS